MAFVTILLELLTALLEYLDLTVETLLSPQNAHIPILLKIMASLLKNGF